MLTEKAIVYVCLCICVNVFVYLYLDAKYRYIPELQFLHHYRYLSRLKKLINKLSVTSSFLNKFFIQNNLSL